VRRPAIQAYAFVRCIPAGVGETKPTRRTYVSVDLNAKLQMIGLHPIVSVQRKVLQPFELPGGGLIPAGNLIAVPQQAILMDGDIYPNPDRFNPYRHLPNHDRLKYGDMTKKYTDISINYPYWGSTRKPW
jgi:hypothetical protein